MASSQPPDKKRTSYNQSEMKLARAQEVLGHDFQHQTLIFCALSGIPGQVEHYDKTWLKLRRAEGAAEGHNAMKMAINMRGASVDQDWDSWAEQVCGDKSLATVARRIGLHECILNPPQVIEDAFLADFLRACVHAVCLDFDSTVRPSSAYGICNRLGLFKTT